MANKYFLYSEEQIKEKNKILEKTGKKFQPGTVVVNGVRKQFSCLSSNDTIPRFIDTKIIAFGEESNMTFTKPTNITLKGN